MSISKNGQLITDLDHWGDVAGPKSESQWVPGRSAMEAARFWLAAPAQLPAIIADPIQSHADFGAVTAWSGEPEVRLPFDRRKGEPRNTDLLITCSDSHGSFLLAVEAKADETFGETVAEAAEAALERRLSNDKSRGVERIVDLTSALLPPYKTEMPELGVLRYQLLTATAGALAEAARKSADRVVVVIQEFRTDKTSDLRHAANARDLDAFVMRLSAGSINALPKSQLVGPFTVPGKPLFDKVARLYFLKVESNLRGV